MMKKASNYTRKDKIGDGGNDKKAGQALNYVLDIPREKVIWVDKTPAVVEAGDILARSVLIGIDTETRPNWTPGGGTEYPTALLQVATRDKDGLEHVFIFDLLKLLPEATTEIDKALTKVFQSAKIFKMGQGLNQDLTELHRFYPKCECFKSMRGVVEANALHAQLEPDTTQPVGLARFTLLYLHANLSKRQQCSNWACRPLTEKQLHYAALDALVLLRIHDAMIHEIDDVFGAAGLFNMKEVCVSIDAVTSLEEMIIKREKKIAKAARDNKKRSNTGQRFAAVLKAAGAIIPAKSSVKTVSKGSGAHTSSTSSKAIAASPVKSSVKTVSKGSGSHTSSKASVVTSSSAKTVATTVKTSNQKLKVPTIYTPLIRPTSATSVSNGCMPDALRIRLALKKAAKIESKKRSRDSASDDDTLLSAKVPKLTNAFGAFRRTNKT